MKFVWLFLLLSITCSPAGAQDTIYRPNRMPTYQVVDNDTIYFYTLPGFNKVEIKDSLAQRKFLKLVRDVRKTLPYAKMAAYRLQLMEQNLALMSDGRQKKAYIKQTEAAIKKQFMDDLTKLTITQGKILVKLIHRETGHTTYELLHDYKGNAGTFFWQTMAKMFGSNLRQEYDPVEDYQIEMIIKSLGFE
ncbi:MAG: DUF4294 domain-containing protein [Bacteroidia bacterium]|nr:DUF4294 domain-containing protein [Bacteroidia bacterium]